MQVWWIACASMIRMVSEAVTASYTLREREKQGTGVTKEPMAFEAGNTTNGGGKAGGKKEL